MKKEILVYEKDKEILTFLRLFFRGKKEYLARFIKGDEDTLRRELGKKMPDAVIIGSPEELGQAQSLDIECPIIAMIPSAYVAKGIRSVVKFDVEYYLLAPFYKEDLEHKLRLAIERKSWFENLYKEKKDLRAIIELTHLVSLNAQSQRSPLSYGKEVIRDNKCEKMFYAQCES